MTEQETQQKTQPDTAAMTMQDCIEWLNYNADEDHNWIADARTSEPMDPVGWLRNQVLQEFNTEAKAIEGDVVETTNALTAVIEGSELVEKAATDLLELFQPFFDDAHTLIEEAAKIKVTDATQVSVMKQARIARLKLRVIRTGSEKARKEAKEDSLRTSRAIDNVARVVKDMIEPVEATLLEAETFAERAEAAAKAIQKAERIVKLNDVGLEARFYAVDDMTDDEFAAVIENHQLAVRAKADAEARAAADLIAAERAAAEQAEADRIDAERERIDTEKRMAELQAEKEAAEAEAAAERKQATIERQAAEAVAHAERERVEAEAARAAAALKEQQDRDEAARATERAKLEAAEQEIAARREVEAKAERARKAADRRLANAPDAKKILALVKAIDLIEWSLNSETTSEAVNVVLLRAMDDLKGIADDLNS